MTRRKLEIDNFVSVEQDSQPGVRSTEPGGTRYSVKLKTAFGLCHSVMRLFKTFIIIIIAGSLYCIIISRKCCVKISGVRSGHASHAVHDQRTFA